MNIEWYDAMLQSLQLLYAIITKKVTFTALASRIGLYNYISCKDWMA